MWDVGCRMGATARLRAVPTAIRSSMGAKADRCPACKYDLRGLDDPRDCPECGHFVLGPLPRGNVRLPVVSRIVSYAALVLLIPGNVFIYGHPHHPDIGELLIGASGLASMT